MFEPRNDTEACIKHAFDMLYDDVPLLERKRWIERHSRSLERLVDGEWKLRAPGRRNRPSYRNIQNALRRMVAEGYIEEKEGHYGSKLYRKVTA